MSASAKKYKLFAASDGDGPRPCAFFASEAGCRNGDACKFSHGAPTDPPVTKSVNATPPSDVASVVSSESEGAGNRAVISPPARIGREAAGADTGKKKKAKRKNNPDAGENIFANPKPHASGKKSKQKNKSAPNQQIAESSPVPAGTYAAMAHSQSPFQQPPQNAGQQPPATGQPPKKKAKREPKTRAAPPQAAATPSFRDLELPLAPFSIPETDSKLEPSSDDDPPQHRPAPADAGSPHAHPPLPLPKSTPEGRKWRQAVIATRSNDRYEATYDFDSYREADAAAGLGGTESWVKAKPFGPWCASNPPAIAIDCEMCETRDPVSGVRDSKALCRISVVNATNPDDVLLDTLVKPVWPVVDYRSRINGIKKEDLEGVQFTLRHAQAFLMALCSEETVILGHALHNDLVALRMEHNCNVDSAFLFTVKDEPGATASLRDLAMAVLGKPMPNTHDSVNDARTALKCLESYVERGGQVEPIARSYPRKEKSGSGACSLLVHRIPKVCRPEHISQMFLSHTFIQPKEVGSIDFGSSTGKVNVAFSSHEHARLAFETLSGEEKPDKTGKLQKKVYMRNGDYVQVRKMTKQTAKN